LHEKPPTQESGGKYYDYDGSIFLESNYKVLPYAFGTALSGVLHKAQSFEYYEMVHYWVPVPKGLWYRFNGEDLRIPDNGMFDLMTGEFRRGYKTSDGSIGTVRDGYFDRTYINYNKDEFNVYREDGMNLIYLNRKRPDYSHPFNYFDGWTYSTTDIDYIIQTTSTANTFVHPDAYATAVRTMPEGLVLPVSKVCADTANRVVGEWYFSGDQWFESKNSQIYAGEFDKTKLTKLKQNIALVKPATTQTYYVYLDPAHVGEVGETSDASYSNQGVSMPVYYNYVDANGNKFYFDGCYWIPEDYTQFNTIEHNKNYAVIPDSLPYYSLPIEDEAYIVNNYHYGERLTVLYTTAKDAEWGFTGIGWIRVNSSTVSEVQ
jgi:hypothetical protein